MIEYVVGNIGEHCIRCSKERLVDTVTPNINILQASGFSHCLSTLASWIICPILWSALGYSGQLSAAPPMLTRILLFLQRKVMEANEAALIPHCNNGRLVRHFLRIHIMGSLLNIPSNFRVIRYSLNS